MLPVVYLSEAAQFLVLVMKLDFVLVLCTILAAKNIVFKYYAANFFFDHSCGIKLNNAYLKSSYFELLHTCI